MIRTVTAAALVLASFAGVASAETVKVSYSDLNLSNAAGVQMLNHRVSAAITKVCGEVDPQDLSEAASIMTCRTAAKVSSTQQIASVVSNSQRFAMTGTELQIASR